jgi:sulfate permease, SulP family
MWPLVHQIKPRVVVLDMSAVPDLEYTALIALSAAEDTLKGAGVRLWLVALNPRVGEVIARSPLGKVLGREQIFATLGQAVTAHCASRAGQLSPPVTDHQVV